MIFKKIYEKAAQNFREKDTFGKLLSNFFWLLFDKFFRMGVGLFVSVLIIRHLGSETFGKWNYVIAFQSFFSVFITLGLDTIVMRELVLNKGSEKEILGSTLFLRISGATAAFFLSNIIFFIWTGADTELSVYMFLTSFGAIFLAFDSADLHYRSELKSKVSVLAKNSAFALTTFLRIYLLCIAADLKYFVAAAAAETVLGAVFLLFIYRKHYGSILRWKPEKKHIKKLISESWTWALALFITTIYMKIDQIFIGDLLDKRILGIYSASQKLYDIVYSFISMAFFSLFPKIAALYERNQVIFEEKSRQLVFLFTLFAVLTAIFMFFWGDTICALLYGAKYVGVEKVVVYHFFALIFVANGFMRSGFLTVRKNNSDLIYINATTAVLILPLNYFVIQKFGIEGAAAMTVVLQAFAFWLSNLFFASTRPFFYLQTRAMLKIFDVRAYFDLIKKR